ncbi:MAG TPA: CBS domain-containing protein [Actinomycetota bacterium]
MKAPDFVQQMMSSPVVHVAPDDRVADALRAMIDRDIGAVVVVEDGRPVGVFTERDVSRRILDDPKLLDRWVGDVMSAPVVSVAPTDEVVFIFGLMTEKKIRRLPVVEGDRLVGIVTERDLLRWVDAVASE